MKNMHIRYAALLLFVLLSASASSFAQTVLEQKISAISAIKEIRPLETSEFSEKYVTYFIQPLDHRHPEKGSFRQRVIVSHVDRKSTRLNSSHPPESRMPSSA